MEEKLWAQQLADEDKQLNALKEQQAEGVINKYNALILQAIRDQWILPETYPPEMYCQLLVNLQADGGVLNVQITKSSGNEGWLLAVDRRCEVGMVVLGVEAVVLVAMGFFLKALGSLLIDDV